MDMKKISSGRLRAVGYDERTRVLRVQLDDGSLLEYAGIGPHIWQRLATSASAWSYYRDNIEEEFAAKPVSGDGGPRKNPLDDLFGKP